jgi:hypothetical protein
MFLFDQIKFDSVKKQIQNLNPFLGWAHLLLFPGRPHLLLFPDRAHVPSLIPDPPALSPVRVPPCRPPASTTLACRRLPVPHRLRRVTMPPLLPPRGHRRTPPPISPACFGLKGGTKRPVTFPLFRATTATQEHVGPSTSSPDVVLMAPSTGSPRPPSDLRR